MLGTLSVMSQSKEPKPLTTKGLRIGVDLSYLVVHQILPERTGWEVTGDYQWKRNWFAATEFGGEQVHVDKVNFEYDLQGSYVKVGFDYDGVILNAAAYTHTSVGIGDAVKGITTPVVELHISNVHAREEFRHHSYIAPAAKGVLFGFGLKGYELAIQSFL